MIEQGCLRCNAVIGESFPHWSDERGVICLDCAFKSNLISSTEYLSLHGVATPSARAIVRDNEIYVAINEKFDWETTDKRMRFTADYERWRQNVFIRDNFTCSTCGMRGSTLNAHHKKSYKDHPEFRLDVDNGVTLCLDCHRKVHKRGG